MNEKVLKKKTTETEKKANMIKTVTPYVVSPIVIPIPVHKEPREDSEVVCPLMGGKYTIVEKAITGEKEWGKLASGVGWLPLDLCSPVK